MSMRSDDQSQYLAVDVAIIPPSTVQQRLSELNRQTLEPPEGFRFGPTRVPHLTLAQQLVARDRISELATELGALLRHEHPIDLTATAVSVPRRTASLGIAPSPSLTSLHERIMDLLLPFRTAGDEHAKFFADGETPRAADLKWVKEFRQRSAYASFDPHITLGLGRIEHAMTPFAFVADHVGLYHLGRFCTCRQALASWTLTARSR